MGMKNGDDLTIPVCFTCHDMIHRAGKETDLLAGVGIEDAVSYARGLYYGRDEYEPFE